MNCFVASECVKFFNTCLYVVASYLLARINRGKINVVDEVRRKLRTDLDALRDRARKPLTDWEAAEDDRKTKINEVRTLFADACDMPADATLEDLAEMSKAVEAAIIDPAIFGDLRDNADAERIAARVGLAARKAKLEQAEADRIELERLRAEKAEAERKAAEAAAAEAKKNDNRDTDV